MFTIQFVFVTVYREIVSDGNTNLVGMSLWFSLCAIEFSKPATGFPHVAVFSREMKSR